MKATNNPVNLPKLGSSLDNFANSGVGATYHYHYAFACVERQGLLCTFKLTGRENPLRNLNRFNNLNYFSSRDSGSI